jgi:hypothetical protein
MFNDTLFFAIFFRTLMICFILLSIRVITWIEDTDEETFLQEDHQNGHTRY